VAEGVLTELEHELWREPGDQGEQTFCLAGPMGDSARALLAPGQSWCGRAGRVAISKRLAEVLRAHELGGIRQASTSRIRSHIRTNGRAFRRSAHE